MWIQKILEMNIVQGILLLILGWLMGLLSPIVVDGIKKRRQVKQIVLGIQTELTGIRIRLVATASQLAMHFGKFDRPFLEWLKKTDKNNGTFVDEELKDTIETLLAGSDEELTRLNQMKKAGPCGAIDLMRYHTPFWDSHVMQLSVFRNPLQNYLMEAKTRIGILNEQIEKSQIYHKMTFDSDVSTENHKRIEFNRDNTYEEIAKTIRQLIDIIDKVFSEPQFQ